jgi:hypothetical protein
MSYLFRQFKELYNPFRRKSNDWQILCEIFDRIAVNLQNIQTALATGSQVFPTNVFGSYTPQVPSSISVNLAASGTTDIVNITESGFLICVTLAESVAPSGGTWQLEIQIDNGTTIVFLSTNFVRINSILFLSAQATQLLGFNVSGLVNTNNSVSAPLFFNVYYQTSIRVSINVTSAASSGTLIAGAMRAIKTA